MAWKKANKALIEVLEKQLSDCRCDRRLMFGSPTFFVNGNMFAGVHEDTIIMRLSESDLKGIFTRFKDVRPFTPMGARVMKEYAAVPETVARQPGVLKDWLARSLQYAASLPPKAAKSVAGKK